MRKNSVILLALFHMFLCSFIIAQGEEDSWKTKVHVTGYINTVAEYHTYKDTSATGIPTPDNLGIGLSDAGFLVSFKPLQKLEIKTTVVYTPWVDHFQDFFVEMYGAYTFSPELRVAAGKFLSPLSPTNLDFFAPLNYGVSLPMLISHNSLFSKSISGIQLAGEFGDDFKLGYNLTYGSYQESSHQPYGVLGIRGREDFIPPVGNSPGDIESEARPPLTHLGGTGRVYFRYDDIISLGFNTFEGTKASYVAFDPVLQVFIGPYDATSRSYGFDGQIKLAGFELRGEYWWGTIKPDNEDLIPYVPPWRPDTVYMLDLLEHNTKGYYVDLAYNGGIITPWVRYEYIDDAKSQYIFNYTGISRMSSFGVGIAFRPIFETLIKLEYRRLFAKDHIPGQDHPLYYVVYDKYEDFDYIALAFVLSF